MKINCRTERKIGKRVISATLAMILSLTAAPLDFVPEEAGKLFDYVMTAHAVDADELAALIAEYNTEFSSTLNSPSFTSGGVWLSKYSKCFEDPSFAADHASDTITLATTGGSFLFDSDYRPIGSDTSPFCGTIKFTTEADEFNIESSAPIFECVSDSVKLMRLSDSANITININRISDVGDEVSPLFARRVKGLGVETAPEWKIKLNSDSSHSYSGVLYEMYNGAKINLAFTDDSDHTALTDANDNIVSGSIIDNKQSNTNYGILCGKITGNSNLQATYINTQNDTVTFIGTENAYCGGLVGELNGSQFELLSGSSTLKVQFETAKDHSGLICGHMENSTLTLPTGYTFQGIVDGKVYAGGIAGYCKNSVVNYATSAGVITLDGCNVKNNTNTNGNSAVGGVFGYYECDTAANDILLTRTYGLTGCKVEGAGVSGGIAGEYKVTYTSAVTIDVDDYSMDNTTQLKTGTSAGGLFGKYTENGNVTITDSDLSNAHFISPSSSVPFGGIIGEYVNTSYTNTLTLSEFTVNNLNCTSTGSVGGVIGTLSGETYVSANGVSITNVTADSASYFGGIISKLDDNNAGSFIDVSGNYTFSTASGKTYKGGAIAGSFKTGVIRLAGTTDISGAQAANGYAQLVFENDETLVYAKGSGSDTNWTLKRNVTTTASDLGQWGEVVRLFDNQNAEDAGIVSVSENKVTLSSVTSNPSITDEASFAKVALNMQLNDGSDHGALCFASGGVDKSSLLSSAISVSGTIDLAGTGLLGLMHDGGNGKYLKSSDNTFQGTPDFFTGSISGTSASTDKILLAVGETYGCDASGVKLTDGSTGGRIYLSENWGHDAQGLIAFGKGASFSNITIGGNMHVSRVAGSNHLYMSPVAGAMTNGATLTNVTVNTTMTADRANDAKFYLGGVSGVFDGNETAGNPYSLSISGGTIKPTITLTGLVTSDNDYEKNNTYAGGVLGLLKGAANTQYNVSITSSDVSPTISIGSNVTANPDYSYVAGMIGRIAENKTNERSVTLNTVTMSSGSLQSPLALSLLLYYTIL